jgi:hypothetical protein
MGDDPGQPPAGVDSFQPGRYSVWAYFRESDGDEPLLFTAYEWETAGLRGIRVDCTWLFEEESLQEWEQHPEFETISGGMEAAQFARLVETERVHRIGIMPPIGRYAEPPTWLI